MPDRILVAIVAKLTLYEFRQIGSRFPELLKNLEESGAPGREVRLTAS